MFRKMRRFKQELNETECKKILKNEVRGVLSVIGDDGYPYGLPIDYWYDEIENRIYFHGAKEGHKLDAIKKCNKVSFCTYDKGYRKDGEWPLYINSVIVFGKISIVNDNEKIIKNLCYKFTDDENYVADELEKAGNRVCCLELIPEHISGKLVKES
jgi:nitroimidazol reductase NimA-like FMN-containing flavoprotein (pyridoxamine 5'-phosphate oxidase superfamily)